MKYLLKITIDAYTCSINNVNPNEYVNDLSRLELLREANLSISYFNPSAADYTITAAISHVLSDEISSADERVIELAKPIFHDLACDPIK